MTQYLIMCRSLTAAQRSQRFLERSGISVTLIKAPQGLNTNGCGYALSLRHRMEEAVSLLRRNGMLAGKIFKRLDSGDFVEIQA